MRTPLRRSIAQVLKIARAGGRSPRQRIWSDAYAYASRADLRHAWLSVRRPERRLVRHALLESHGVSCGRQLPQMTAVRQQ